MLLNVDPSAERNNSEISSSKKNTQSISYLTEKAAGLIKNTYNDVSITFTSVVMLEVMNRSGD